MVVGAIHPSIHPSINACMHVWVKPPRVILTSSKSLSGVYSSQGHFHPRMDPSCTAGQPTTINASAFGRNRHETPHAIMQTQTHTHTHVVLQWAAVGLLTAAIGANDAMTNTQTCASTSTRMYVCMYVPSKPSSCRSIPCQLPLYPCSRCRAICTRDIHAP